MFSQSHVNQRHLVCYQPRSQGGSALGREARRAYGRNLDLSPELTQYRAQVVN